MRIAALQGNIYNFSLPFERRGTFVDRGHITCCRKAADSSTSLASASCTNMHYMYRNSTLGWQS